MLDYFEPADHRRVDVSRQRSRPLDTKAGEKSGGQLYSSAIVEEDQISELLRQSP